MRENKAGVFINAPRTIMPPYIIYINITYKIRNKRNETKETNNQNRKTPFFCGGRKRTWEGAVNERKKRLVQNAQELRMASNLRKVRQLCTANHPKNTSLHIACSDAVRSVGKESGGALKGQRC